MSRYTMEIRNLCEAAIGLSEHATFDQIDNVIQRAIPSVFNFNFPIFDENYRVPLEAKILKYFWRREIGTETVGEFKLNLSNKLNRIMPLYNQMYKSELLNFDPFINVNYKHDSNRTVDRTLNDTDNTKGQINRTSDTTGNGDSTVDSQNTITDSGNVINSNTPQGLIDDVLNKKYATDLSQTENTRDDNGATTSSTHSDVKVTDSETNSNDRTLNRTAKDMDQFLESIVGKQGTQSYASMLMELRESFLNIDSMILDELNDLFFGLWG